MTQITDNIFYCLLEKHMFDVLEHAYAIIRTPNSPSKIGH